MIDGWISWTKNPIECETKSRRGSSPVCSCTKKQFHLPECITLWSGKCWCGIFLNFSVFHYFSLATKPDPKLLFFYMTHNGEVPWLNFRWTWKAMSLRGCLPLSSCSGQANPPPRFHRFFRPHLCQISNLPSPLHGHKEHQGLFPSPTGPRGKN